MRSRSEDTQILGRETNDLGTKNSVFFKVLKLKLFFPGDVNAAINLVFSGAIGDD